MLYANPFAVSSPGLFDNLVSVLNVIMNNELVNEGREIHLRIKHSTEDRKPECHNKKFA